MASGGSRPGAGRRRKDPALKQLAGTVRKGRDRQPQAAVPAGDGCQPMIAPMYLADLEQLIFGSVVQLLEKAERASPDYCEHVALLAIRLAQVQRLNAVLEMEGDTFTSERAFLIDGKKHVTRMVRARPEVSMLSDAMRQAQSLIGELMLNPSAALRLASGHKPAPGAFDDF